MKCIVCGSNDWWHVFGYNAPDKYEDWVGLKDIQRTWRECEVCGMYQQERNYPIEFVEKIYANGYRHPDFRGENIEQAFRRINAIPNNENDKRIRWLTSKVEFESVLDIGSGIGVFPSALHKMGFTVWATEANKDSQRFINSVGIPCFERIPKYAKWDVVSMVHLLEHFENPLPILEEVKPILKKQGKLFIEVPSAKEFDELGQDNDEFNSCHCSFFNANTLTKTLNKAGYKVQDVDELYYPDRKLTRLLAICRL